MSNPSSAQRSEGISVMDEKYDSEIDAMAVQMKKHTASTAVNPTLAIAQTTNNKRQLCYEDYEDVDSIKGGFSWTKIGKHYIPYILRTINGEKLKFVSTRIAETQLLEKYFNFFNTNINKCISIISHFITDSEAGLLNDINQYHCNFFFGNEMFFGGKDYIVRLEDIYEFYTFLEVCYEILLNNSNTCYNDKFGVIILCTNGGAPVPYFIKNNHKLVPLQFFEGKTANLSHEAVELKNWELAYVKFSCQVVGIKHEYWSGDSWKFNSLNKIKNYYNYNATDTNFEEFWPSYDSQLCRHNNSTNVNLSGAWFRKPPKLVIFPNTGQPLVLVIPHSMPVMMNTYQNGRLANEMSSAMSQGSILENIDGYVVSPPLGGSGNTAPVMGQCITTMNNSMANNNMMSLSNQMRQSFRVSEDQHLHLQQKHIQQQQQKKPQQQPQQITTPQTQQSSSGHSEHGRLTNNQLHKPLRKVGPVVITPATEIIDLSSPPSSPIPPTVQETSLRNILQRELIRTPKQNRSKNINTAEYKSSAMSQGSILENIDGYVVSPPLGGSGNTAPVMGQCITTMNNSMANNNMMSLSNQMRQSFRVSEDQHLHLQQKHIQQQQQKKPQQQPQQITTPQTQQSSSGHSEHGRLTNNQLHKPLRKVGPVVITPATEIIDLSSPPSSPIPPTVQETSLRNILQRELIRTPKQNRSKNINTAEYKSSAMSQGSILENIDGYVVSPPLGGSGNTAPVMGQCITTMNNSMANNNMMSLSNQMRQSFRVSEDQHLHLQQKHIQQQQQKKPQQQPQQITTPQTQQSSSGHSEHGRLTNNQLHKPLRKVGPVVITPATEIIDLSSPPSSPIPPTVQETSLRNILQRELIRTPKQNRSKNINTAEYKSSAMSQGSILENIDGYVVSPPLGGSGNTAPVMDQCITTMNNSMANNNMMSLSNQMRQSFRVSEDQHLHLQQKHIQQQQQKNPQQQPQQITTPQTQQSSSGHSEHGRLTNNQLHKPLRKVGPVVITPATEIIDLSSPPSSPIPPTVQETSLRNILQRELIRTPKQNRSKNINTAEYKIRKSKFQGRTMYCVNFKPYAHTYLLVALEDLVQRLLPSCTVMRCALILQNEFKIRLFSASPKQFAILRENINLKSIDPKYTVMVYLNDIKRVWNELKTLMMQEDQNVYQSEG